MNAQVGVALAHWGYIAPMLSPISSEAQYAQAVESLDSVLDAGGADESNPLAGLADLIGERISAWEHQHHPMPQTMPANEVLAFLMDQHGLRQCDLPEVGTQGVVSELLTGKRSINLRQARLLAARFGVGIELFV
ncbi:transcriptional regulator [Rhodoferax sp.]|uniref:helix-turn-helix domain-containing protein n=1 Tax=Rhodoferax sp. TaxID=50421 RepID=UPI002628954C|nr:transcriptional regulator [Rhodoferax sp.]MDD2808429.1 transcriptional regulator [Rhodoferax sp.]MDD4944700.1 transcriptional regulator [Rhodoferax sp.]